MKGIKSKVTNESCEDAYISCWLCLVLILLNSIPSSMPSLFTLPIGTFILRVRLSRLRQLIIVASLYVDLRQVYVRSGLLSDKRPQKN